MGEKECAGRDTLTQQREREKEEHTNKLHVFSYISLALWIATCKQLDLAAE